jgi:hypothetical protein
MHHNLPGAYYVVPLASDTLSPLATSKALCTINSSHYMSDTNYIYV